MKSPNKLKIPNHLKSYVVEQEYNKYTARDHALWRFVMRNMKDFLKLNAHSAFLHGLEMTGVPTEQIPKISEMNEKLSLFGWSAVCVRGFIPPLAFLDFQSNRILPIAADMRSVEHFEYTPAPDIVHEAAGHAPILADEDYRNYLVKYANIARKAIFSNEDIALYEAIRFLSDVKENPDSKPELIQSAEENLKKAYEGITWVSEAAEIARMYWWTVEYGLVGNVKEPKLYGAGLLSSLGESRDCLGSKVKKIPFSVECVKTGYDITEPQPQLFVAKDFKQLTEALEQFEEKLSYKKGGEFGLSMGKRANSVTTAEFDSGLEVSGILKDFLVDKKQVIFLSWEGPVQLCFQRSELENQGTERHELGFSTPLGPWKGAKKEAYKMTDKELLEFGLKKNVENTLEYESGFKVKGILKGWMRSKTGDLVVMHWDQCTVTFGGKIFYNPEWGEFDLAIGTKVSSVYGGPADWDRYGVGNFGESKTQPGRMSPFTEKEKHLFSLYTNVRTLRANASRDQKESLSSQIEKISEELYRHYKQEWLLALELAEVVYSMGLKEVELPNFSMMKKHLLDLSHYSEQQARFIRLGLELAKKVA